MNNNLEENKVKIIKIAMKYQGLERIKTLLKFVDGLNQQKELISKQIRVTKKIIKMEKRNFVLEQIKETKK